jgi:NCS1 family nucleobase:cation symporter-1
LLAGITGSQSGETAVEIKNASPSLYNEDLAPAKERNWGAFSIFNVWTSDVHSLWGYYLAASLFLLCGSFVNFILAIGIGSLVIFVLMSLVGNAGVRTGVPYPVLARASFGIWGANIPALVRAVVACFWYGAQTAAASGAIVALLTRIDSFKAFHQSSHMLGHSTLEVICFVVIWALATLDHPARHGDGAPLPGLGRAGGMADDVDLAVYLCIVAGGISLTAPIPQDVLLEKTRDAGCAGEPGSLPALCAVAATWITYFAALYLNFCDFSRYAPDTASLRKGNLWGLPVNLILFSLVAGVTTIAAFNVYHEVLLHPDQISAKFDSWFLALLAAVTFAVATLGINVVANFVSPAFDFSNVFPRHIDFKKGGYIAALIALALYPFAPWEGSAASFVGLIGATMGPIFGIMMVDYYLIAKGRVNVPALYQEHGEYRFQNGWNVSALIAAAIGALFSSVAAELHLDPAGVVGGLWLVLRCVAIAGAVYYALRAALPSPVARTA